MDQDNDANRTVPPEPPAFGLGVSKRPIDDHQEITSLQKIEARSGKTRRVRRLNCDIPEWLFDALTRKAKQTRRVRTAVLADILLWYFEGGKRIKSPSAGTIVFQDIGRLLQCVSYVEQLLGTVLLAPSDAVPADLLASLRRVEIAETIAPLAQQIHALRRQLASHLDQTIGARAHLKAASRTRP